MMIWKAIHAFGYLQWCAELLVTTSYSPSVENISSTLGLVFQLHNPLQRLLKINHPAKNASSKYRIPTKKNLIPGIKTELIQNNYINLPFKIFSIGFTFSHYIK